MHGSFFPGLHTSVAHLIEPDRIIPPVVQAMLDGRRLGLIGPLPEQEDAMIEKFAGAGARLPFAAASPYTGTEADFSRRSRASEGSRGCDRA
ncbi:AroM family protein [Paenibacillus rhizoplanae]